MRDYFTFSPRLYHPPRGSGPPWARFSAEGCREIKLTAYLDPARSFYSTAHLRIFFPSQHAGEQLIGELTGEF